jgi:hypothetical protein
VLSRHIGIQIMDLLVLPLLLQTNCYTYYAMRVGRF